MTEQLVGPSFLDGMVMTGISERRRWRLKRGEEAPRTCCLGQKGYSQDLKDRLTHQILGPFLDRVLVVTGIKELFSVFQRA